MVILRDQLKRISHGMSVSTASLWSCDMLYQSQHCLGHQVAAALLSQTPEVTVTEQLLAEQVIYLNELFSHLCFTLLCNLV